MANNRVLSILKKIAALGLVEELFPVFVVVYPAYLLSFIVYEDIYIGKNRKVKAVNTD